MECEKAWSVSHSTAINQSWRSIQYAKYNPLYYLGGAIKEFWGYEANEFVEIELRKSSSKSILPKNMFALHFLSSMSRNKVELKPWNSLFAPSSVVCMMRCSFMIARFIKSHDCLAEFHLYLTSFFSTLFFLFLCKVTYLWTWFEYLLLMSYTTPLIFCWWWRQKMVPFFVHWNMTYD